MIDCLHRTTPTALSQLAQGCEACLPRPTRRRQARATLGEGDEGLFQPQWGCGTSVRRTHGRNRVAVVAVLRTLPKVAPRTAQPWAGGRKPVGILGRGRAKNGGAK